MSVKARIQETAQVILAFRWGNYGLDEVGKADPEYAVALATEIVEAQDRGKITIHIDPRRGGQ